MADSIENRRRELSRKAWAAAFDRLCATGGQGANLCTPEIDAAEKAANAATEAYVRTGKQGAREALERWEALVMQAIEAHRLAWGCGECHDIVHVVEVVDEHGNRACSKCRTGTKSDAKK